MGKPPAPIIERIRQKPRQIFVHRTGKNRARNKYSKTDQASIFVIQYKGRLAIFRWHAHENPQHNKQNAMARYYAHRIAHELFPKFTPKVLGVEKRIITLPDASRTERWGLITEIVKRRSRDYKEYHEHFYDKPHEEPLPAHEEFVNANTNITGLLEDAGVCANCDAINIVNSGGTPIHIEIAEVIPSKVLQYIVGLPKTKQDTVKKLLQEYSPYRRFG